MMDSARPARPVFENIRSRRSIRRYRPDPVSREVIDHLLESAMWAPSAHNRQPWRFAVIVAHEAKLRLATAMCEQLRADRQRDGDSPEAIQHDVGRSRARLVDSPAIVVACLTMRDMDRYPDPHRASAERMMAVQSVSMAVQNLLLAAHAAGLGACWMCAPLFCPDTVRETLRLPDDWEPQALITLGWPADSGRARAREPLSTRAIDID